MAGASRVFLTNPQDAPGQPWFHNQAARLEVDPDRWTPEGFLRACLEIESAMGRVRGGAGPEPRTIDLDLLLWGNEVIESESLTLPHPRMAGRAFVLAPLAEIVPNLVLPTGERVADLLAGLLAREGCRIEGDSIVQEV